MSGHGAQLLGRDNSRPQSPVGSPKVAAAIAPFQFCVKSGNLVHVRKEIRLVQFRKDPVSLRIDIRRDMMRNLACGVTEPDPFII